MCSSSSVGISSTVSIRSSIVEIWNSALGIKRCFFPLYSLTWKFVSEYDFPSLSTSTCCSHSTSFAVPFSSATIILLRHLNHNGKQTDVLCSAYGDIVYHLANKPKSHQLVKQDLVLKKFLQVQFLTGKNIITLALRQV